MAAVKHTKKCQRLSKVSVQFVRSVLMYNTAMQHSGPIAEDSKGSF